MLQNKLDFLNARTDQMEDILNSLESNENDNAESVADKIEQILKKLKREK